MQDELRMSLVDHGEIEGESFHVRSSARRCLQAQDILSRRIRRVEDGIVMRAPMMVRSSVARGR